jgi:putative addiction module component (TIGR02574 family)
MSVAAIHDEVLNLSAEERVRLIEVLWNSLSNKELKNREVVWATESERRIDAFDSGTLQARDADEIFSDLKKKL